MKRDTELSPQQRHVLQLAWDGLSQKESAEVLGVSEKTIKNYRAVIYRKFGVRNIEGALRLGVELQYLATTKQCNLGDWP